MKAYKKIVSCNYVFEINEKEIKDFELLVSYARSQVNLINNKNTLPVLTLCDMIIDIINDLKEGE